jgi:transcriptional regulator with XRE-family HTH domain
MSRRFQPTPSYRIFLDLLVKERTDRSFSQEELATRLDLSPAQIEKFELGHKQIDFVQTREWCQALGVTFLDFMVNLDREITAQLSDTNAPDADADAEGGAK